MEEWKNRLTEEYRQTKERYEKLKAYNNKRDIEERLDRTAGDPAEYHKQRLDDDLRHEQQRAMGEYLHWLELRAVLHSIQL